MKKFKTQKAYLVFMLVLSVFIGSLPVYGGSHNYASSNDHVTVTRGSSPAKGPAPVKLGTAGNFVILAKTGVSTTGTTAVVGDIGIVLPPQVT